MGRPARRVQVPLAHLPDLGHLPIWAELRIGFSDKYLTEIAAPRAVIRGRPRQPVRISFLFTNS
jgi:hypothetical protein